MSTILCFVFFFKATYLCLEKKSISKDNLWTLFSVKKTFYTLCLYCANTPYVTGFFAQEKTELKQLWIEFFTRLKFTSFKIFRMEKQIISVDGWWKKYIKTRSLLIIPKEKEWLFSLLLWSTSFILIDFLPLPSVDFFFHTQQFF